MHGGQLRAFSFFFFWYLPDLPSFISTLTEVESDP